jgi:hypothetical protein
MTASEIILFCIIYVGITVLAIILYKVDKYVKKSAGRTDVSKIQRRGKNNNIEGRELRKKGGEMEGETFYDW